MLIGILILLLCLIFTSGVMITFTMILHGGISIGALVKERFAHNKLKLLLLLYPFIMWLPVIVLPDLPNWHWVVYFYINLLLTIAVSEICYTFRKERSLYGIALWLNILNGSLLILLLLFYYLKIIK